MEVVQREHLKYKMMKKKKKENLLHHTNKKQTNKHKQKTKTVPVVDFPISHTYFQKIKAHVNKHVI